MNFTRIIIILFIIFSVFPIKNISAQTQNVGIIPSNIWYSKDPFEEGDKIKIYTVVYNSDTRELSGTVIFFDNNILLGKENFSIAGKTNTDVSIDWTVTTGDHIIFAKIENARFLISKDKYEDVYLAENKTAESKKTVAKKIVTDLPNIINDKISNVTSSVTNIGQTIKDITPTIVTKTIESTSNSLENIRTNLETSFLKQKNKLEQELDQLNESSNTAKENILTNNTINNTIGDVNNVTLKSSVKNELTSNNILKPLKYVELFFIKILSFIFENKLLFYGFIIFIFIYIIRSIFKHIF